MGPENACPPATPPPALQVRTLKQQANALTDEASGLRYKLNSAASAGELLRSQVVHSPQKLAALLDEISSAVERERGALAEGDRRSRDLHARMDVIGKVEKEVQKAIGLMAEVEAAIGKKKDVSRKVLAAWRGEGGMSGAGERPGRKRGGSRGCAARAACRSGCGEMAAPAPRRGRRSVAGQGAARGGGIQRA